MSRPGGYEGRKEPTMYVLKLTPEEYSLVIQCMAFATADLRRMGEPEEAKTVKALSMRFILRPDIEL